MKPFDVYPLMNINPIKANGSKLWDHNGNEYLDLYGGHAVISVGHSHPHYVSQLVSQINKIGFYSNSVVNKLQEELAFKLGQVSGYPDYNLFLCNSGAEANENALKLASFHNQRKKVIAFDKSFHGRTSLSVGATNDSSIQAEINKTHDILFLELNNEEAFLKTIDETICAVIIEGIQGVAGIRVPDPGFLRLLRKKCDETGALLILDEVQSGYGRSGKFFAHQFASIIPDLITIAKGMGNGFPIGGVLISSNIKSKHGLLGTTFGGNHLACVAGIAVLDIILKENLVENAGTLGDQWIKSLRDLPGIKEVRGKGLMIGIEFNFPVNELKTKLTEEYKMLVGTSSNKNTLRLLPALNISENEIKQFNTALSNVLTTSLQTQA